MFVDYATCDLKPEIWKKGVAAQPEPRRMKLLLDDLYRERIFSKLKSWFPSGTSMCSPDLIIHMKAQLAWGYP